MSRPVEPDALPHVAAPVFPWLFDLEGINRTDALLYGLIALYRMNGDACPSHASLARDLRMDIADVRARIRKLERCELLYRRERPGESNEYVFLQHPAASDFATWGGASGGEGK